MTLNEIGEEFDLTRERVRQIKERQFKDLDTVLGVKIYVDILVNSAKKV